MSDERIDEFERLTDRIAALEAERDALLRALIDASEPPISDPATPPETPS